MKHRFLLITLSMMAATPSAAEEVQLRYRDPSGGLSISTIHDISAGEAGSVHAERTFAMDFALRLEPGSKEVAVTIEKVKGSYTAHEMKQRLPTNHLGGKRFMLLITDSGKALLEKDSKQAPAFDLGRIIEGGYPIGLALVDLLPVLPLEGVAVGTSWTTEREVLSLEGWAWASGQLHSRHSVSAIDQQDGHPIVTVETQARAHLGAVAGGREYKGEQDLNRSLNWRFDATSGRLLSMSLKQETKGVNELPQGQIPVRQLTTVELTFSHQE